MEIVRVTDMDIDADPGLIAAFVRLVPQLSATGTPPTRELLAAMVASADCILLIARDGRDIVGSATLTLYRIPTGIRARIDDVIVDVAARGRGIGEALTVRAIDHAREAGASAVNLTSRPDREAANRLYLRLGFERVDTNVYRFRV